MIKTIAEYKKLVCPKMSGIYETAMGRNLKRVFCLADECAWWVDQYVECPDCNTKRVSTQDIKALCPKHQQKSGFYGVLEENE